MSSLADLPELIGFFSYSRDDDDDSRGALSELRDRIQRELRGQLGRSRSTLRIWQDKEAIAPGKLWESEIGAALEGAVFFIPIVTPTTVKSQHCKHEFESFLARERALGRTDLVFPIYYIRVPTLEREADWRSDPLLSIIAKRQWVDWRELRLLEVQETMVREAVAQFCAKIVETLQRPDATAEQHRTTAELEQDNDQPHTVKDDNAARAEGPTAAASQHADKLEQDGSATAKKEPAAADTKEPTLLAAIWPETEQNRDHRYLAFVAVGVLAIAGAATFVDAPGLIFGRSNLLVIFHPAVVALYVVLISLTFWPGKSRKRFRHYLLIATVVAAAICLMSAAQGWTYSWRTGYMLLPTSILYVGIIAAGNPRVTVPLVVLSALAVVAIGFTQPDTPTNIVLHINARLLIAGEILVQGLVFAGVVAVGWASPMSRMIAAIFLINLAETIWAGIYLGRESGTPVLIASIVSTLGVAAVITLAWQYFTQRPMPETATRLPE
jgi:hypothetical protein